MSDDHSPGDGRKPYSDRGGPEARHAETHDVRREELTNPKGPPPEDPSFAEQLAPLDIEPGTSHAMESISAADDKALHERLPALDNDELARLSVLEVGARLEQGGTYLDLNHLQDGPFKALGGHEATTSDRYIAKRDTDYELWNRLVGDDREPDIERPDEG
ncbi:MAG: hypothetical protein M3Q50_15525 [Chloroflexota bacterium]|nr:hypothetical protein [Chloroflexia bacterium]MDQ3228025.1 hypothetical protein [Chloroflexota bacterium]